MIDKLKLIKALGDPEKRELIKKMVVVQVKLQKASEATAACIAEGLGEPQKITELTIGEGKNSFLPLDVTVTSESGTMAVESVQPENADYDYKLLCEDFNGTIAENPDVKEVFLKKTAELLNSIVADNGAICEGFATKIV